MHNAKKQSDLGVGWPAVPRGLSAAAKRKWTELCEQLDEQHRLHPSDAGIVEAAATAYAKAKAADAILAKRGGTIKTSFYDRATKKTIVTGERPRPEVAISRQSWAAFRASLNHLGLTPSKRASLNGEARLPQLHPVRTRTRTGEVCEVDAIGWLISRKKYPDGAEQVAEFRRQRAINRAWSPPLPEEKKP